MDRSQRLRILAIGAILIAASARAQPANMPSHGQNLNPDQAMMQGMETMNHDMAAAPMTGDADRDFVAMMIPHHQGAIDMAQVELHQGKDPALRRLANQIVAAQKKEIAMMRQWQAAHTSR